MTLASGRFAMIDDGLGFQLVPWRPALEKEFGREVRGVMAPGGNGRVEFRAQARAEPVVDLAERPFLRLTQNKSLIATIRSA